ncbi:hypothetical protein LEP1GSC073_1422 [Leptospira noguchii str. Cascata]|nr:hypothetical protein LEP1GSC073_1422 [Leptospira noguchii str. Cascata]
MWDSYKLENVICRNSKIRNRLSILLSHQTAILRKLNLIDSHF